MGETDYVIWRINDISKALNSLHMISVFSQGENTLIGRKKFLMNNCGKRQYDKKRTSTWLMHTRSGRHEKYEVHLKSKLF